MCGFCIGRFNQPQLKNMDFKITLLLMSSYIIRSLMVIIASVRNKEGLFGHYSLTNTVPELCTQHLYCIRYYK